MRSISIGSILLQISMAASVLLLGAEIARAEETIRIADAWVRHAPPSAQQHAGYLTLTNLGPIARSLVAAESTDYARVEFHVSRVVDGAATMEPVAQVEVGPGQTVRFAPGGLHLMLIGPKAALKAGSTVSLTFAFSDGQRLTRTAIVKKDGAAGQAHGHHRGH